jgi:hypothetical protein
MAVNLITTFLDKFIPRGIFEVFPRHFGGKFFKGNLVARNGNFDFHHQDFPENWLQI